MKNTKMVSFLIFSLMLVLIIGCASEELTSAKLYIQQEDWENAEIYLLKALDAEPENPEVPYLLGDLIYGPKKDWGKMNEMFDKALSLGADKPILTGAKVSEYVAQAQEQHWVSLYNQGISQFNEYRNSGEGKDSELLQDAISTFTMATQVNPNAGQTYGILANCLYASGDLDGALETISKGTAVDPNNADLNASAARLYSESGDNELALVYYKKAVELDPTNISAMQSLAQTYYDLGEKELALAVYEEAIAKATDNNIKADLYYNLGVLAMQLNDFQKAEDNFAMAYDLNPDDIDALRGVAQTFENAEEWSRAEYYYRKLIEMEPENPQHYRAMARVLLRQGETDKAQEYFDKSKEF